MDLCYYTWMPACSLLWGNSDYEVNFIGYKVFFMNKEYWDYAMW